MRVWRRGVSRALRAVQRQIDDFEGKSAIAARQRGRGAERGTGNEEGHHRSPDAPSRCFCRRSPSWPCSAARAFVIDHLRAPKKDWPPAGWGAAYRRARIVGGYCRNRGQARAIADLRERAKLAFLPPLSSISRRILAGMCWCKTWPGVCEGGTSGLSPILAGLTPYQAAFGSDQPRQPAAPRGGKTNTISRAP